MVECPCGDPHDEFSVEIKKQLTRMIAALGDNVDVTIPGGTWNVPRAYIAFHGMHAQDVPILAREHGWARVL